MRKGETVSVYLDAPLFTLFETMQKASGHKSRSAFLKDIVASYLLSEEEGDRLQNRVQAGTALTRAGHEKLLEHMLFSAKLTERIGARLMGLDQMEALKEEAWAEAEAETVDGDYFLKD